MLNSFSKALNGALTTKGGGFDIITDLLIEYGYGGNYWSEFNYPSYSFNGYAKNVVVNHCISSIADSVADLQFILKINKNEVENDPLLDLLNRPNPRQSFKEFMRFVVCYKLIAGNTYVRAFSSDGMRNKKVFQLETLRPDRVTIVPNTFSLPAAYLYTINGITYEYPVDPATFLSDVLHVKYFHPMNDLYGLSPIQVAMMNIDQHNSANEWNQRLLNNHAKPSGVYNVKAGQGINAQQRQEIEQKLKERITGKYNAGNPVIAGVDFEWIQTSLSPAEMDWVNSKGVTARDICLAFKYPPFMLGMAEGSTFNNLAEAKLSFYEETVIPLTEHIYSELAYYLTRMTGRNIQMIVDKDKISALAIRRQASRDNAINAVNAGVISIDEAREEIDYDALELPETKVPLIPAGKLPADFEPPENDPDAGGDMNPAPLLTPPKFNDFQNSLTKLKSLI